MTPEERDIIVSFIARVSGAPTGGTGIASVPSTAPALPPIDRDADALIAEQFARYPEARYRLTQLAFVQEHALAEAQNRLKRLEWELQQAQQAAQQAAQPPAQPQPSRGFLGGLFGGGGAASPQPAPPPQGAWGQQGGYQAPPNWQQQPPPPPQYAPGYQQGMFQRPGSGFLGSALTTAAGVAGGMVVGNALMDMFSPRREAGGLFGGGTPVEGAAASPWAAGGALPEPPVPPQQGYVDQGAWSTPDPGAAPSADSAWAQPQPPDQSGWADNSGGGGDWTDDNSGNADDDSFT